MWKTAEKEKADSMLCITLLILVLFSFYHFLQLLSWQIFQFLKG